MFIKAHCPVCNTDIYHNIRLHALESLNFEEEGQTCKYAIKNIDVTDSLTEEELVRSILQGLQRVINDEIEIEVLAGILREKYGITEACCSGLLEKIQLELSIYCSDKKRFFFADSEEPGNYAKKETFSFIFENSISIFAYGKIGLST